jgi:glucose dehydrogenase
VHAHFAIQIASSMISGTCFFWTETGRACKLGGSLSVNAYFQGDSTMRNSTRFHAAATLLLALTLTACSDSGTTPETASTATTPQAIPLSARSTRTADTMADPGQWPAYGRDYSEQRYSPLDQVNADNIDQLDLAWYADLDEKGGAYETTPVVADGRVYVSAPWSKVYAFDGASLWETANRARSARCRQRSLAAPFPG